MVTISFSEQVLRTRRRQEQVRPPTSSVFVVLQAPVYDRGAGLQGHAEPRRPRSHFHEPEGEDL